MALDDRQTQLYTDTFAVYKPVAILATDSRLPNKDIKALRYPATPTTATLYGFHKTVGKLGKARIAGREAQETTTANTDRMAFEASADVDINYALQKTVVGDPDYGQWFVVEAKKDINNFLANKLVVYVRRTTKPPGVT